MAGKLLKSRLSSILITTAVFALLSLQAWSIQASWEPGTLRLVVQKEGNSTTLLANYNAVVLEDYGSFLLVDWPSAPSLDDIRGMGLKADILQDPYQMGLAEFPFDTRIVADCPEEVPFDLALGDYNPGVAGFYIVQFHGPIKGQWLEAIQNAGARVVEFLPTNSYIVWMTPETRDALLSLPMPTGPAGRSPLQWVGVYQPAYKVSPGLLGAEGPTRVSFVALDGPEGEDLVKRLLTPDTLIQAVSHVGPYLHFKAVVDSSKLKDLAFEPTVYRMEPWSPPVLFDEPGALNNAGYRVNGEVAGGVPYMNVLTNLGFNLTGIWSFAVNVTDTGLDKGNKVQTWHSDLYGPDHATTRVAYVKDWTSDAGGTNDGTDGNGHGTCCAGVVGGFNNDAGTGTGTVSTTGYRFGVGVAPCVKLGGSKVFTYSGSWGLTDSYTNLERNAYTNGARISSNSWGFTSGNNYNADCAEYDSIVRDASADAGNQEYTIVFAAANAGPSANTTRPPGTAKNVITLAAAENWWPSYTTCGWPACFQNTPGDDVVYYSSRGPTADGRRKPDIAAIAHGWNAIRSQYGGTGCGNPFDTADPAKYRSHNGTSAATPAAAGSAALIYQKALSSRGTPPSPAMIKAILAGTTRDLAGGIDANNDTTCTGPALTNIPNTSQGWGLVNVSKIFDATSKVYVDQTTLFTATGQTYNKLAVITDNSKPVRVVLAFTDAPGNTSGNAWNNDLNLTVVSGGNTYLGNVFSGGYSTTGGTADAANNLEVVNLPAGTSGNLNITVTAANIVSDGVPGNGSTVDQDFALFVYNGTDQTSSGVISLDKPVYNCNDAVVITVSDADLRDANPTATITVSIASTTESTPETVTLTQTGANTGVYTGSIATTSSAPPSPGQLSVSNGDTITATYHDANHGGSGPLDVTATASADCSGPVISNVMAVVAGQSATVTWDTNESANSRVTYGTAIPPATNKDDGGFVTSHTVILTGLLPCTQYFFSVTSADPYANSATDNNGGTYYTFTTSALGTQSQTKTETPPLAIPDNNTTGASSVQAVAFSKTISKVTVKVNITHTYDGDITLYLIGPDATQVTLSARHGGSGDNYTNTVFDDAATTSIAAGTPPYTGSFKPDQPLSAFNGKDTAGSWTLKVVDSASSDTGTINDWTITFTVPIPCTADLTYDSNTFTDACTGAGTGVGNGYLDPGEDITLKPVLRNDGGGTATGVSATLSTTTPGVTITTPTATYPSIVGGGGTAVCNAPDFKFSLGTGLTCGTVINFNLHITASGVGPWDKAFTMTVGHVVAGGTVTLVNETFNGVTTPNLPAGWTIETQSGNPWTTSSGGCSGNALYYHFNASAAANSWAYLPVQTLTAGVTYTIAFNEKVASGTYPEKLSVTYGTTNNHATQTNVIWPETTLTNTTCAAQSATFTVPSTGTYYVAFHCTSAADMYNLYVDDVVLSYTESPSCTVQACTPGAAGPPRVPQSLTPVRITTSNHGTDGALTWDATNCPSINYHIVWGYGSGLPTWTTGGGVCAIGTTVPYSWTSMPNPQADPSNLVWFLVVGDDGATTEGSWGLGSDGLEEGGASVSTGCGMATKNVVSTCPTP